MLNRVEPRILTETEAADYAAGGNLSRFKALVRSGLMPSALPYSARGPKCYDKKAIDIALDALSGFEVGSTVGISSEDIRAATGA